MDTGNDERFKKMCSDKSNWEINLYNFHFNYSVSQIFRNITHLARKNQETPKKVSDQGGGVTPFFPPNS